MDGDQRAIVMSTFASRNLPIKYSNYINKNNKNHRLGEGSFYEPLRVLSSWSDSHSVIYVTFANTKHIFENNKSMKDKNLTNLT